jgi:hypothetical protein
LPGGTKENYEKSVRISHLSEPHKYDARVVNQSTVKFVTRGKTNFVDKQEVTHYKMLYLVGGEPGSSIGTVSGYGLDGRGSIPRQGQRIFPLTSASRPALGPTQPPVQWVPGALSPGGKARPERDADRSTPSSAEVKKE